MNIQTLILGTIVLLGIAIIKKLNQMPTKAEFDALRQEMNDGLNNIADDITRLTDTVATGDLTAEEEAQVFTDLRAVADRIRQIAAVTPEPGGDQPA